MRIKCEQCGEVWDEDEFVAIVDTSGVSVVCPCGAEILSAPLAACGLTALEETKE